MGVHAGAGHGDRFFSDFAPSRRYTPRQQRQQNLRPSFLRSLAVTGAPGLIHSGLFIALLPVDPSSRSNRAEAHRRISEY